MNENTMNMLALAKHPRCTHRMFHSKGQAAALVFGPCGVASWLSFTHDDLRVPRNYHQSQVLNMEGGLCADLIVYWNTTRAFKKLVCPMVHYYTQLNMDRGLVFAVTRLCCWNCAVKRPAVVTMAKLGVMVTKHQFGAFFFVETSATHATVLK